MFYTETLNAVDTSFVENEAVKEGLAVMSVGVLEDNAFSNVSFAGNIPHCPASQYGYEQQLGKSVRRV